jgi:hypothetical protein
MNGWFLEIILLDIKGRALSKSWAHSFAFLVA